MNKRTIFISLVLALIFVFTSVNADTPGIMDIDKSSSYAKEAILALAEKDIVKGDNLGNFNPTKSISRAEFITLLVRVLNLDTENVPATATFKDVPANHWAFKYVEAAYKAGIVNGISPTEFGVTKTSTREQMAVMFVRALKLVDQTDDIQLKNIDALTDKDSISTWAQREVDIAMTAGLMNGMSATTFAPKANATKEQTAVVIDRFMQNEGSIAEKVNTAYGLNSEFKLLLNGDAVAPGMFTVDENNNVYVTREFIDKYVLDNSELKVDVRDNGEIFINLEGRYANKSIYTLWFKGDSKNAYRNVELGAQVVSPYTNEEQNKDKIVELKVAPIVKDGKVLIPAEDLADMLGAKFTADAARNRVVIEDSDIVMYPNLYDAIKKGANENYIGDMDMIINMNMSDLYTKDFMNTNSQISARANNEAMYYDAYTKLETNTDDPMDFESKLIITGDKVYELDLDGKWIEYNKSDWEKAGGLGLGVGDPLGSDAEVNGAIVSKDLAGAYYKLPLHKAGSVKLDNVTADKYVMELGSEDMKYLITDEQYSEMKELLANMYNGTAKYNVEFYIADGHIVKEIVNFSGVASDSETDTKLQVKMTIDVAYRNIGVNGPIVLPKASDIKQPE